MPKKNKLSAIRFWVIRVFSSHWRATRTIASFRSHAENADAPKTHLHQVKHQRMETKNMRLSCTRPCGEKNSFPGERGFVFLRLFCLLHLISGQVINGDERKRASNDNTQKKSRFGWDNGNGDFRRKGSKWKEHAQRPYSNPDKLDSSIRFTD